MRFNRFRIDAYGPFTDLEVDLSPGERDLHVFHGPNEAGKSSFLRAVRALLFGIPAQSADNFLHGYKQLRIAAELEKSDGTSRLVQRRKGNKNTLLDANGDALADAELATFLGVVDQNYFDSMFGLGSEELREGADELLRGEGRLGQALFSASLGGTPVERVIQDLEEEAARYFSGRARKGVAIREAVKELADHRKRSRESAVRPKDWEELVGKIEALEKRRLDLLTGREELANRKAWLERCRDALTLVGQLGEARRHLESLPAWPELANSFGEEIRTARKTWQDALVTVGDLENRLEQLHERAKACPRAPRVIEEEAAIDALHTEIGVYRDHKSQLVAMQGKSGQLKAKVDAARRDLGMAGSFEQLDAMRVSDPEFLEVREKASSLNAAEDTLAAAQRAVKSLRAEITKLRSGRPATEDAGRLKTLESTVQEAGMLELAATELEIRRATAKRSRQGMKRRHQQLVDAPDDHEATSKLPVPSKTSIDQFRIDLDGLRGELARCEAERLAKQGELDSLKSDLLRLGRQRELPSLDDLRAARDHRERGWKLVLEDWKGEGASEELVDGQPLESAYPEAVNTADAMADRLRTEAEAVAQIEEKQAQCATAASSVDELTRLKSDLQASLDGKLAEWNEVWSATGIVPRTPTEMAEWRESWLQFCQAWDEWVMAHQEVIDTDESISSAEESLAAALGRKTGTFLPLLAEARENLQKQSRAIGAEQALENQILEKEGELVELENSLPPLEEKVKNTSPAWESCRDRWSLPEELSPPGAVELLRSRRELFRDYDLWQEVARECGELEKTIDEFESRATETAINLELGQDEAEKIATASWKALQAARKEETRFEGIEDQIATVQADLEQSVRSRDASRRAFVALLERTGLDGEAGLDDFLGELAELVTTRERIRELRDTIAGFTRGEPVDEFIARVDREDADAIDGSLITLGADIAGMDDELEIVRASFHEWERRQREMEQADDESARQAQLAESAAARIHHDADRFVRLRLAISLLAGQIDQFRAQNQGPFMEKAGHWFSSLTGAAFTGITTSYDAGDEPVIAGLRTDAGSTSSSEVFVDGMSEGTRDQLYLALRLAGLEMHLAEHEPMPMILDDLLVHFDDSRARHALGALGQLATRSQVLLFTHHTHLVGLAREALGDDGFHLHEL